MYQLQTSRTSTLTPVALHQQPNKLHSSQHNTSVAAQPVSLITQVIPKPQNLSTNKSRRRGVVLTEQGWQKLLQAEVIYNHYGERYSFEELSGRALLDPRTVCRIIDREVGVDRRSLNIFFNAFNLKLETGDYIIPARNKRHKRQSIQIQAEEQFLSASSRLNSQEELTTLKQQIIANCQLLARLLGLAETSQTTLTVNLSAYAQPQLEINLRQHYNLNF
ncbi:WD-repeat protein (plasmid) [Scytonema sp. HK-05]|uniref:hypothetical protein n=1 Tax=Scytonema sp. HK-05 TaxID=1137095 RepID=UPI000936FA32|nr:hypothetical protein [Scytonema sp. HK-05]OKH54469.1 hypothetical protein NIES2130_28405 [Scytonema sp. HK-05]BAY49979.1 WD-repeat protein [Scytonema sp. HK-05]